MVLITSPIKNIQHVWHVNFLLEEDEYFIAACVEKANQSYKDSFFEIIWIIESGTSSSHVKGASKKLSWRDSVSAAIYSQICIEKKMILLPPSCFVQI